MVRERRWRCTNGTRPGGTASAARVHSLQEPREDPGGPARSTSPDVRSAAATATAAAAMAASAPAATTCSGLSTYWSAANVRASTCSRTTRTVAASPTAARQQQVVLIFLDSESRLKTRLDAPARARGKNEVTMSERTRLKRIAENLCVLCGSSELRKIGRFSKKPKRLCESCRAKENARHKKYVNKNIPTGMCYRCRKVPRIEGIQICQPCKDILYRYQKDRKAKTFFELKAYHVFEKGVKLVDKAKVLWTLWKQQKGKCALTGIRLNRTNSHIDHIVPLSKGGTHNRGNIRWLLKEVNLMKGALTDQEFIVLCRLVVAQADKRGRNG